MKNIILSLLSVIVAFSFFVIAYIYKLMAQNDQTIIPIVDSHIVSEGILDDLSDPNEENSSSSSVSGGKSVQAYWGNGRIKVYVDPQFPIIKVEQKDPNVENFLIFGVDSRSAGQMKSRTDSMIIVTLDKNYNTIKMTSILRDTQVKIPGRTSPTKINAAYVFGGVGLMVNTINQNFDLDIQKFAMVDMWSAEKIIDAMGGITLNVTSSEIEYVNTGIRETNRLFAKSSEKCPYVAGPGLLLLNGRQAVAYGRIRKIGSDLGRSARQRKVLSELIRQFKVSTLSSKMAVLDQVTKSFESNVAKDEMVFLAIDAFSLMKSISQYRVPTDGMYTTNTDNWQMIIDYDKQLPALHSFIWGAADDGVVSLPEESPEPDSSFSDGSDESSFDESSLDISQDSMDPSSSQSIESLPGDPTPTIPPASSSSALSDPAISSSESSVSLVSG